MNWVAIVMVGAYLTYIYSIYHYSYLDFSGIIHISLER